MKKNLTDAVAKLESFLASKAPPRSLYQIGASMDTRATEAQELLPLQDIRLSGFQKIDMLPPPSSAGSTAAETTAGLDGQTIQNHDEFWSTLRAILKSDFVPIINQIIASQGSFSTISQLYNIAEHNFPMDAAAETTQMTATGAGEAYIEMLNAVDPPELSDSYAHMYNTIEAQKEQLAGKVKASIEKALHKISTELTTAKRLQSARGGLAIYGHDYVKASLYSHPNMKKLLTTGLSEANFQNPEKSRPTLGYCALLKPDFNYSSAEAHAAKFATTCIPTIELSRCVPYFNMTIRTPQATSVSLGLDGSGIVSPLSTEEFLGSAFRDYGLSLNQGLSTVKPPVQPAEPDAPQVASEPASVGMEAFTMPQSIVPIEQDNAAFGRSDGHASVDKTRPFMTLTSFKAKVLPTRGAMSNQSAELSFVLHDRRRLSQLSAILKPATMSQVEFDIEYGWSHPAGIDAETENVYGQYLNSLRTHQTFSMIKSGYSFTDDGQVNITVSLVTKGVASANETDASITGQHIPGHEALTSAYEALQLAQQGAGDDLKLKGIAELKGTQHITTTTLSTTGLLLEAEAKRDIQDWIDGTKIAISAGGMPNLEELVEKFEDFQKAVKAASQSMEDSLTSKMDVIQNSSYEDWPLYTHVLLDDVMVGNAEAALSSTFAYNIAGNKSVGNDYKHNNKVMPLGLLLHLFLIKPLISTGMYDEVQLVTYTANNLAGAAAGANLGALPIDVQAIGGNQNATFEKVLKAQYKKWGGQFPVTRCIDYIKDNFIKPDLSLCYGLANPSGATGNSNLKYDTKTGTIKSKDISNPGDLQAKITKKLRSYYYGDESEGSAFTPRPADFRAIDLKIVLESGSTDVLDLIGQGLLPESTLDTQAGTGKTVLRVHVFDGAQSAHQGAADVIAALKSTTGGLVVPPLPKALSGINPRLRRPLFCDDDPAKYSDISLLCKDMENMGILSSVAAQSTPLAPDDIASLDEDILNANQVILQEVAMEENPEATNDELTAIIETYDDGKIDEVLAGPLTTTQTMAAEYRQGFLRQKETGNKESEEQVYYLNSSPAQLIDFVSTGIPTITYGEEGSTVTNISIQSNTNSKMATTQMLRAARNAGEGGGLKEPTRGLPTRLFPAAVSVDMFGNPLLKFMQKFFLKAGTNTTIDNMYAISSIDHTLTQKEFKTSIKLIGLEAYGVFTSMAQDGNNLKAALATLQATEQARVEKAVQQAEAKATARASRSSSSRASQSFNKLPVGTSVDAIAKSMYGKFYCWALCGNIISYMMMQDFALMPERHSGIPPERFTNSREGTRWRRAFSTGILDRFQYEGHRFAQLLVGDWEDDPRCRSLLDSGYRASAVHHWAWWGLFPTPWMKTWDRGTAGPDKPPSASDSSEFPVGIMSSEALRGSWGFPRTDMFDLTLDGALLKSTTWWENQPDIEKTTGGKIYTLNPWVYWSSMVKKQYSKQIKKERNPPDFWSVWSDSKESQAKHLFEFFGWDWNAFMLEAGGTDWRRHDGAYGG